MADDALDVLAKGLPPRELHVLVFESLAAVHGDGDDDRGFGHGGGYGVGSAPRPRYGGALGAAAGASRRCLVFCLLRTAPEKRGPFLEAALPQVSALVRRLPPPPDDDDDGDGSGSGGAGGGVVSGKEDARPQDEGAARLAALVGFLAPLLVDWGKQRVGGDAAGDSSSGSSGGSSSGRICNGDAAAIMPTCALAGHAARSCAALVGAVLDACAGAGALPAGPPLRCLAEAQPWPLTRASPAVRAWDSLASLAFAGAPERRPPPSLLPALAPIATAAAEGGAPLGNKAVAVAKAAAAQAASAVPPVDEAFLLAQPWRFAFARFLARRRRLRTRLALAARRRDEPRALHLERLDRRVKPPESGGDGAGGGPGAGGWGDGGTTSSVEGLSVGQAKAVRYSPREGPRPWSSLGLARAVYWAVRRDAEAASFALTPGSSGGGGGISGKGGKGGGERGASGAEAAVAAEVAAASPSEVAAAAEALAAEEAEARAWSLQRQPGAAPQYGGPAGTVPGLLGGLGVLSGRGLWERLAPHALALLLHEGSSGQDEGAASGLGSHRRWGRADGSSGGGAAPAKGGSDDEGGEGAGLAYGDVAAGEALLALVAVRLASRDGLGWAVYPRASGGAAGGAASDDEDDDGDDDGGRGGQVARRGGGYGGDSEDDDCGDDDDEYGGPSAYGTEGSGGNLLRGSERRQPVVSGGGARGRWSPQVNTEALAVVLIDSMVGCADAGRRARIRITLDKVGAKNKPG